MRAWRARSALCPGLASAGVVCLLAGAAAGVTVTTTDDAFPTAPAGSLREAIAGAAADDTIDFMLDADSTITLASGLGALPDGVTIDASGAPGLRIAGTVYDVLTLGGSSAHVVDLGLDLGDVAIGSGNTLTFTANNDFEVSSDVMGGGSVVKDGDAILTLSGSAGFDDLTIGAGGVLGNVDSLPLAIENDAALVFEQDSDATYTGMVSGTGSLEKTGNAELTLAGANTYQGGTTISEGTLRVVTTTLPGDVVNNAMLVFDQAGDGEFMGDISGSGTLTKDGSGDVTLSGSNTYSGGTDVMDGDLTVTTGSLGPGAVDLATGTTLEFAQDADGSFAGDITGDGGVDKTGAGSVRLSGSNDYVGGTNVMAGELVVDADSLPGTGGAMVANPGKLVFDQASDGEYAGVISGDGSFDKAGVGTLELSAVNTFSGAATISAGSVDLAGSWTSDVTVGSAGTLGGGGNVTGTVTVNGALAPGLDGAGTFATGDVTFATGSRLEVDVSDDGSADDQLIAGAVTFDSGAEIVVDVASGDYDGTTVDVVDGTSLAGTIPDPADRVFIAIDAADAGSGILRLTLTGAVGDLVGHGVTPNQKSVGAALDRFTGATPELSDPDVSELFDNMVTIETEPEVQALLDALSGESVSSFTTARQAMGERFQRSLHRRMRSVLFAGEGAWPAPPSTSSAPRRRPTGPTDVAAPPRPGERGIGSWLDGYAILGDLDGDGNAADARYTVYGGSAGLDLRLGDHGLAGLSAGYARTDVGLDGRDVDGEADSVQGAVYAAYASRLVYAGVSGRYAWSRADSTRRITVDELSLSAKGDFDSHDFGARGELAINAFELRPVRFQPLAAFEWSHLAREGFREKGAGSLGLDVDSEELDTALLQLGGRVDAAFPVGEEAVFAPELRAFWLHELGDRERRVEATIAGAPFTVQGAEAPRDGGLLGVGWSMGLSANVRASADYDVRIDADRLEHVGSVSVRVRF